MTKEVRKEVIEAILTRHVMKNFAIPILTAEKLSKSSLDFLLSTGHVTLNTPLSKRTDWDEMSKEVLNLIKRLRKKPKSKKLAYQISPAGILNAFCEGDLTFAQAKKELGKHWK